LRHWFLKERKDLRDASWFLTQFDLSVNAIVDLIETTSRERSSQIANALGRFVEFRAEVCCYTSTSTSSPYQRTLVPKLRFNTGLIMTVSVKFVVCGFWLAYNTPPRKIVQTVRWKPHGSPRCNHFDYNRETTPRNGANRHCDCNNSIPLQCKWLCCTGSSQFLRTGCSTRTNRRQFASRKVFRFTRNVWYS